MGMIRQQGVKKTEKCEVPNLNSIGSTTQKNGGERRSRITSHGGNIRRAPSKFEERIK